MAQKEFIFNQEEEKTALKSHFSVVEDSTQTYTPEQLLKNNGLFRPLDKNFKAKGEKNTYWLLAKFKSTEQTRATVSFSYLSYADLYYKADTPGAKLSHRQAGAFRPIEEITNGDSRFHFSIKLDSNVPYTILIKSRHTKKYSPVFDFYLSDTYQFLAQSYSRELNDLWPQGASALLFFYIFLRWISTRYKPFVWLMLFVGAFNLYGIALNRYFIDWFFSSKPILGWLFVQHFLHFGLVGLYMLLLDSWNLKQKDIVLYRWGKGFIYGLLSLAFIVFVINYFTGNNRLSANLTIGYLFLVFVYSTVMLIRVWKKLDQQELLLAYGLICYMGANIVGSMGVAVFGEYYYTIIPNITKAVSIFIAFLFLMGLNGRLRQNAKDKTRYLKELNLLQQHQNELLEESVRERTKELSNRSAHIETLMNELNHRVKNNLQMLYGLNSLRLAKKDKGDADSILKDNISRIKAMMLVNENLKLNEGDEQPFDIKPFIDSIIAHSSKVFDIENTVDFKVSISPRLVMTSELGLPLGLIISELIVNSYKHAFRETISPEIHINLYCEKYIWHMTYSDNGSGMPINTKYSFGTELIKDLTRQIEGHCEIENRNGLTYHFTFSAITPCVS